MAAIRVKPKGRGDHMRPQSLRRPHPLRLITALVAVGAALHVACSGAAPPAPSQVSPVSADVGAAKLTSQNAPPELVWKTQPPADGSTVPPTVTGQAPFTVRFNLCRSDDPDMTLPSGSPNPNGDSLNWQFNFGDSAPAFNSDGTFNPDFDHFCRVEHTYAEGTFTATLSVTDKHLDDQARDVTAMARQNQLLRIVATSDKPAAPVPSPTPLPYCHALPQFCPSQQQFCEATPIDSTSSASAKHACEACYGIACVSNSADGNAWVAAGVTAFYYSYGSTGVAFCSSPFGLYNWTHKPADVGDLSDDCGAGLW
jgi:hypothetical protein